MGESWYWIKQRPHFIAEYLGKNNSVKIFCEKRYKHRISNKIPDNIDLKEIYKFPLANNSFIKVVNEFLHKNYLFKKYFKNIDKDFDIIWLNSPKHYEYLKKYIGNNQMVIYDCMDDIMEFRGSKKSDKISSKHFSREKALYLRSDIVFCSSDKLKKNLHNRYGEKSNVFVINNGINIDESGEDSQSLPGNLLKLFNKNEKTLCYIGTVSEWFDFDLILKCLNENKSIGVVLIGPNDVEIPYHERLYHHAPIDYSLVKIALKKANALIMPFVVSELVKAVNPVKLYEYINSCVPSISVSYPETEKFSDYIYLYKNFFEFDLLVKLLLQNNLKIKLNEEAYLMFAKQNTWEKRCEEIVKHINILKGNYSN
jgi:glycosyltransferase involved in cell wall biosynthesis